MLLESVFHDVHQLGSMIAYDAHLHEKLLAHIEVPPMPRWVTFAIRS